MNKDDKKLLAVPLACLTLAAFALFTQTRRQAGVSGDAHWTEWIQAVSALASVFLTVGLIYFTNRQAAAAEAQRDLMRGQLIAAEIAANAAKASTDSSIISERAHIYPTVPLMDDFGPMATMALMNPSREGWAPPLPGIALGFGNFGRTPSIVHRVRVEIAFEEPGPEPMFTYALEHPAFIIIRAGQQDKVRGYPAARYLSADEVNRIAVGTSPVYLFGYVKYTDIFQQLHTKSFGFRITCSADGTFTEPFGGSAYINTKSENAPHEYLS